MGIPVIATQSRFFAFDEEIRKSHAPRIITPDSIEIEPDKNRDMMHIFIHQMTGFALRISGGATIATLIEPDILFPGDGPNIAIL